MSFVPFTHKEKNFAIVDLIEKDGITLKGREGEYKVDVSAIKNPEVGQTVFLIPDARRRLHQLDSGC